VSLEFNSLCSVLIYNLKKNTMKKTILLMLLPILGLSFQSFAQGDLIISPTRVVFEGKKQTEELNLINNGKDTMVYTVSFVQKNMMEDGSFVNIEKPDPGQMFADSYLRIFPRTITLAPGEPQVIKLQYTRKKNMIAGEYRSHLYFRAEKNTAPIGLNDMIIDTTKLVVQLVPIFGISIPIIIRSGNVHASSTLSNLKLNNLQDTMQTLNLTINRTGNNSLYGNLEIEFIPKQGKPYQVGVMNGVGVYTNINKRNVVVKLNNNSGKKIKDGKLKVEYISLNDTKHEVFATAEMAIN
jgi:hypothetical protein